MDQPTKGDLAMIVKHCCSNRLAGGIVKVGEVVSFDEVGALMCAREAKGLTLVVIESDEMKFKGLARPMIYPRSWLQKLPPLNETDDVKEKKELTV